jgi:UDP:flavonoid glycosyltransferase YjiC (YdhE family)
MFTALPGSGHIHPMIPAAQALVARGHDVRFATSPSLVGYLRRMSFDAIGVGPDWMEGGDDSISTHLISLDTSGQIRLFVEIASMGSIADLLEFFSKWRPDAVVSEGYEHAGRLAAELAGIPAATHSVTARVPRRIVRQIIGATLDKLRTDLGLDGDPMLDRLYGQLYLDFVPLRLAAPGARQLPFGHRLRPVVFDAAGSEGLPSWFNELPDKPIIYATLGTVFNRTPGLLEAIIEAMVGEPHTLIVTTGRNRDPHDLGRLPMNVRAERYIPQSALFHRCSVVITHGGFNTLIAALSHGLPVYLLPLSADQPWNAQRAVELGFGLSAGELGTPFGPVVTLGKVHPAQIREGVRRLSREPSFSQAAAAARAEIEELPGPDHTANLLERLATERGPILATA